MSHLAPIGRVFFAAALIGLGFEHFVFQEFVTGRAPEWPASLPGKMIWVYGSGAAIMVAGFAILDRRKGRPAAMLVGVLILGWALLRQIPGLLDSGLLTGSWTRAGKALTFFGGAFAVAGTFAGRSYFTLGRVCLGIFLIVSGAQHFKFTPFVVTLIPGWFPGNPTWWALFAGVALIALGIGLLVPQTARLAGLLSGLMLFSWVWIVHLPRISVSVSDGIAIFEALAFSGIALVIAGALPDRPSPTRER